METEAYRKLSRIDFNDGQPIGIAWDGWTLILDYKNWQEQILRLKFKGVAFVSGYGGTASLCNAVVSCDSHEIEQARQMLSHDWGSSGSWNSKELTQLVISDDVPLLKIVFENVEIEQLKDPSEKIESKFADFRRRET